MAFNKIKGIFGGVPEEEYVSEEEDGTVEEEYYTISREEFREENGAVGNKMMLLEPRAYSESQQIADYLKARNAVVVNLKRVTPDQAKRIVDFLSGTLYAIDGNLQKLGGGIFLCTPNNVNVEGKISDENKPTHEDTPKEEEEFNW